MVEGGGAVAVVLLALTLSLPLLSGCEAVLFYFLLDTNDEDWDTVGEIRCDPDGLRADGKLVIPILEPLDEQEAEDTCSWWQLTFQDDRYQACCGGDCCEWGVGLVSTSADDLAGPGEWCRWSGMCGAGLTCFPPPAGSSPCELGEVLGPDGCEPTAEGVAESGTCRLGQLGEWCNPSHACEEPMYCNDPESWDGGECRLHVAVEGGGCVPAEIEPCLAPMQCACPNPSDCKCWDGSIGDPCNEGTCKEGLSCQAGTTGIKAKPTCVDGVAGDSCSLPNTCNSPLECIGYIEGDSFVQRCVAGVKGDPCETLSTCQEGLFCIQLAGESFGHCGIFLDEQAPCDPTDEFALCREDLVCNTAYPTPVCIPAGGVAAPCARDLECQAGLGCAEGAGQCTGGKPGDPCGATEDCQAGAICMYGQDAMYCHSYLKKGDACDPGNPYQPCLPGLVCKGSGADMQCAPLGNDFAPCTQDGDCLPGYRCLELEGKCFDGKDGDPCWTGKDCAEGWKCLEELGLCFNGNTWDGCTADLDCAAGYQCNLALQACFAGNHGVKCLSSDDCGPGLICLPSSDWGYCFEYLAAGEACGPAAPPYTACDEGLVCNDAMEPALCAEPGGAGTPCATGKHCAAGLVCDTAAEPAVCATAPGS